MEAGSGNEQDGAGGPDCGVSPPAAASPRDPIEFGWLLVGRLDDQTRAAVEVARASVESGLAETFPRFDWRLPLVVMPDHPLETKEEPVERLGQAYRERDARAWDFALVVTPSDLRSHYGDHAVGVPSRALAVAVASVARLSPEAGAGSERLADRLAAVALHLFGDLNGLWHRDEPTSVMAPPETVEALDVARGFAEEERQALDRALGAVADQRLEEATHDHGPLRFYLRAGFERFGEIASAVAQARPWEFPVRLSRLTAAGVSTLLVLLMTAEIWDLATTQSPGFVGALAFATLLCSTVFLLIRQGLLMRRGRRGLSEQTVVTNVSAVIVVVLGILVTWTILAGLAAGMAFGLADDALLLRWAPEAERFTNGWAPRLLVAGFVGSLGTIIGALGGSFEPTYHFRHVIYADEEV